MNTTIVLYLKYKKFRFRRKLGRGVLSLGKTRTWWHIYVGMLLAFLGMNFVTGNVAWFYAALASFFILFGITVYMDYVSGRHVRWERRKIEERARQQLETRDEENGRKRENLQDQEGV